MIAATKISPNRGENAAVRTPAEGGTASGFVSAKGGGAGDGAGLAEDEDSVTAGGGGGGGGASRDVETMAAVSG